MADPVALGIQTPDSFKTIGSMLNFANQSQNLQRGNIDLQQNQIKLQERKGIQDLFSNPRQFMKADGTPDYDKIIFDVTKAAPTTGPEFIPKIIQGFKDSAAAQQTLNTLKGDELKRVGEFTASLGDLPPMEAFKRLQGLGEQSPNLAPAIKAFGTVLQGAANDPAKFKETALQIGRSVQSLAEQRASMTPTPLQVNGPTENRAINIQPQAAAVGSTIPGSVAPRGVGPENIEEIIEGPDGNKYIRTKAQNGTILGTRPLAGGPQGGTGNASGAPASIPYVTPEDAASRGPLEAQRNAARDAFVKQQDLRQNVRGVLSEIDQVSATGNTGPFFQKINSALGGALEWGTAEKRASSYDLVGKYLERIAIDQAQGMGPHTNAGLESAKVASGSVGYNPTAIKKLAKLIDANAAGVQAYQPGLEKAIDSHPQKSVLAKRDFDQAWGKNYDPRIMMIQNASQTGDRAAIDDILKQVGGKNSQGARDLIQKARNIEALSTTGRLP